MGESNTIVGTYNSIALSHQYTLNSDDMLTIKREICKNQGDNSKFIFARIMLDSKLELLSLIYVVVNKMPCLFGVSRCINSILLLNGDITNPCFLNYF